MPSVTARNEAGNLYARRHEILAAVDIESVARVDLGIRIVGLNAGGWLNCHAVGRDDSTPSAAINLTDPGAQRGWYRDRGDKSRSCSFIDLIIVRVSGVTDFNSAIRYLSQKAGVAVEVETESDIDNQDGGYSDGWNPTIPSVQRGFC